MERPVYKNDIETEFTVIIEGKDIIIKNKKEQARIVFFNEGWDFDIYKITDRKEDSKLPDFLNYNGTWYLEKDREDDTWDTKIRF